MPFRFLTLDDISLYNKRVLVRVDINSPIANNDTLLDDTRIRSIIPTLDKLKHSKTVLLAHQSRPGKRDFTNLAPHALVLRNLISLLFWSYNRLWKLFLFFQKVSILLLISIPIKFIKNTNINLFITNTSKNQLFWMI